MQFIQHLLKILFKITLGVSAVIVVGISIIFLWQYLAITVPFYGKKFNQIKWTNAFEGGHSEREYLLKAEECLRCGMVWDLQRNYLKKGTNIFTVKNLLGEPESLKENNGCLSYYLGGSTIRFHHLYVCLDSGLKSNNVKIIHTSA